MDKHLWQALRHLAHLGYHVDFRHSTHYNSSLTSQFNQLVTLGFATWEENKDGSREWYSITDVGKKALSERPKILLYDIWHELGYQSCATAMFDGEWVAADDMAEEQAKIAIQNDTTLSHEDSTAATDAFIEGWNTYFNEQLDDYMNDNK